MLFDDNGFFRRYDFTPLEKGSPDLDSYAASQNAVIRVVIRDGDVLAQTDNAPYLPPPRAIRPRSGTAT